MNCPEARRLLGAHLDEELDVANDAALAAHLESCPPCAAEALALSEQRALLAEKLTRHRAPADLAATIRAALPPEGRVSPAVPAARAPGWFPRWYLGGMLAAGLALGLAGGFDWGRREARADAFVTELTSAHARARLAGHVIDVASSDRHEVKPWFAGKVDFAPFVPNLDADGFPLVGGRLDRVGGRTVATVVYGRRKHTIDVHIWTGDPAPLAHTEVRDGYALAGGRIGDLNFTAVSDASADDLAQFVRLWRAAK